MQSPTAITQAPPRPAQEPLGTDSETSDSRVPAGLQTRLAVSVIVVFIAMLVGLTFLRADKNWDRLIYLLSGFEAIVFAAAGLLFGASISRRSSIEAREDADQAKAEAQRERAVAEQHIQGNLAGDALAKAALAKAELQLATGRPNPDVLELALLAISLSPELAETPRIQALREVLIRIADQMREERVRQHE